MSRWRQNASYGELVKIHRAILQAKEAADAERAEEIRAARENVRLTLDPRQSRPDHGERRRAHRRRSRRSFSDFKLINERMRAGGYHRVRLTGGRGIDG
jgi:hypothetical protein